MLPNEFQRLLAKPIYPTQFGRRNLQLGMHITVWISEYIQVQGQVVAINLDQNFLLLDGGEREPLVVSLLE